MVRLVLALVVALLVLPLVPGPAAVAAGPAQFRAYWVDAFGEGIFTPAEVDKLVADSRAANINALVVQVGRRGDCFCNNASMPRTQAGIAPYPYDPLQTLIDKAHAAGIEVHAWIITTAIWNSVVPPRDPSHVFNTHGPSKTGYDNWIMTRSDGANRGGLDYYLDPGHPAAADYIAEMYLSVIRNYDVDGVNFDRVRYPDFTLGLGVPSWGYNPVAVARFQEATGRTDRPAPTDAQWAQWRRDQVTNIVRKVYVEAHAIKPHVRISADTITYGYGPQSVGGWESTRTYAEVLQDWRGWMREGILDLNIPMNYKRDHFVTEPNNQRRMYHEWNEFSKDNQYRRETAIGSALYLNYIEGSVRQVRAALAPSAAGNRGIGWVGYSYRSPDCLSTAPFCPGTRRSTQESRIELTKALTQPSSYDPVTPPVFGEPAAVPGMPWKDAPTLGHARGIVRAEGGGQPLDQVRVEIYDAETDAHVATRLTDGAGWFGIVDLAPARYKAVVDPSVAYGRHVVTFAIRAGQVARADIEVKLVAERPNAQRGPDVEGFDPQELDEQPNGER
ncbi:MAG TPA: family 10 glycosylhydrolase [Candidatus Limnocylindria bacterium]|nr:family 10 glycosylhydrolase [Candidatus Limnocylindria bacterium]